MRVLLIQRQRVRGPFVQDETLAVGGGRHVWRGLRRIRIDRDRCETEDDA